MTKHKILCARFYVIIIIYIFCLIKRENFVLPPCSCHWKHTQTHMYILIYSSHIIFEGTEIVQIIPRTQQYIKYQRIPILSFASRQLKLIMSVNYYKVADFIFLSL